MKRSKEDCTVHDDGVLEQHRIESTSPPDVWQSTALHCADARPPRPNDMIAAFLMTVLRRLIESGALRQDHHHPTKPAKIRERERAQ